MTERNRSDVDKDRQAKLSAYSNDQAETEGEEASESSEAGDGE